MALRRRGRCRILGPLLALLAAPLLAPLVLPAAAAAQRNGPDRVEVLSVSFQGAEQIPAVLLRTAIETTPTRCISAALQPLCWAGISLDRHYLDPRSLAADVFRLRVFYHQRGFREARVELDTVRTARGMRVGFRIAEGRPVLVGDVRVESAGVGGHLARNLPVRTGQPFSMIDFEAARDSLIGRLANLGYASADVFANYDIPGGAYRADVEFHVSTGPLTRFGAIEITGVDRVSPSVVERMLTFREGDVYSRQALLRSQRNIYGLEVFRHAEIITPRMSDTDSVVPVRIQVNEGDMHRIRLGVGMSTTDYMNAEGRWVSRNFLGGGRRLELRGRVNNIVAEPLRFVKPPFESCSGIYCDIAGSVAADFSQPWFFGPQNALGAGMFLERFSLAGVYVRTSQGAYGSFSRSVGRGAAFGIGYRPELTSLESDGDLIFCVNFVACEERDIDVLRETHWLAPLAFSLSFDRSNSIFAPTRGYVLRVDAEFAAAATGSDYSYARLLGDLSAYHDPFRGVVVAARLRPGYARALGEPGTGLGLHPQKRFFAGGANSVRGFAQYRLGPKLLTADAAGMLAQPGAADGQPGAGCSAQEINAGTCDLGEFATQFPGRLEVRPVGGSIMLEGNLEVRYPIWADRLRGATFIDVGQVWREHRDGSFARLQVTPGVGIRYLSPVGPIRIDVGYNPGGAERLTVVTTEVCDRRLQPCGDIDPDVTYAPADLANRRKLRTLPAVVWQPYNSFTSRLQFHFSIGQAF
jgi:outer membrane protein assembly factor BamA